MMRKKRRNQRANQDAAIKREKRRVAAAKKRASKKKVAKKKVAKKKAAKKKR